MSSRIRLYRHSTAMVGWTIPLAWLVARFTGCAARSEGRKRHVSDTDDHRTMFCRPKHIAFLGAMHESSCGSSEPTPLVPIRPEMTLENAPSVLFQQPPIA